MNERIVCLDIGEVRIGIAVSDPTRTVASPVEVIRRVGWGPDVRKIKTICDRYGTDRVLSGLPLNMDGSEGFQAKKVRSFCAQLEKAGLRVTFQDERLSTVSAEEALIEGGLSRLGRKQVVDKVAAAVILQQYLDLDRLQASVSAINSKVEMLSKEDTHMDEQNNLPEDYNPEIDPNALSEGDIIEMIDENGETVPFIFIDALEYEGDIYLALAEPDEDDEVFFLKIEQDEDGNDVYTAPDEELEDDLFERFTEMRSDTNDEK